MRDMHCHILPGVDDGAQDMSASLAMLAAAKEAGVTSMVCTPHCRDPYFDYNAMWDAFEEFAPMAQAEGVIATMGFEVNHAKLMDLGYGWIDRLAFDNGREFLLELSSRATKAHFAEYERTIFEIQSRGYEVIIAHPERYQAIQKDVSIARDLVRMGCRLQASADFVAGGRLGAERKPAKMLFEENLYSYIASDAHRPEHYKLLAHARKTYRTRGKHARL